MTRLLLDIGADIRELSNEGRRHLLGFSRTPDFAALALISTAEFAHGRERRFGHHNPEIFAEPFWHAMIRSGATGYDATRTFAGPASFDGGPVWCAHRFGQSLTFLPNGCIVQIAGEHEDSYDPDFCIYNDVFLHEPDGRLTIYGYPESVFPPTDFHTATLLGQYIYLIGSAGYKGSRQYGRTPVYRLDIETFAIERLECSGAAPGWIYRHLAKLRSPYEIEITSGTLITSEGDTEQHAANTSSFVLDVRERTWWRV